LGTSLRSATASRPCISTNSTAASPQAFTTRQATAWRQEQAGLARRINDVRTTTTTYENAINAIENTSTLCKEFPKQSPAEQRRLLKLIIATAPWKNGEFEATLKNPFEKLRVSNRATTRKHE